MDFLKLWNVDPDTNRCANETSKKIDLFNLKFCVEPESQNNQNICCWGRLFCCKVTNVLSAMYGNFFCINVFFLQAQKKRVSPSLSINLSNLLWKPEVCVSLLTVSKNFEISSTICLKHRVDGLSVTYFDHLRVVLNCIAFRHPVRTGSALTVSW